MGRNRPNPDQSLSNSPTAGSATGRATPRADLRRSGAQILAAVYYAVTAPVTQLTSADFARPARCEGLTIGPQLAHLLFDAQRALMAFGTPVAKPAYRGSRVSTARAEAPIGA